MRIDGTPATRRCGRVLTLAACGLSAVVIAAPAGLASAWRTQAVIIDGLPNEGTPQETLDRGPSVGAVNDDEFLYLTVSTRSPEILGRLSAGLIIWLDPAGKRSQAFGLRISGAELAPLPGMNPVAAGAGAPGAITTSVPDHLDLLGPGKNQRRLLDLTPELGIAAASSEAESEVVYELKIPLRKTSARTYAVGAGPGTTIGLGIATPEPPSDRGRSAPLVGSSGIIGGNPFYGGRDFAPYREDDGRRKPLEIWTTLTLAATPAR